MSNPLAIFRKHQKILLAVFGVALMIVFTVGGIVSQYMGRSSAASNNKVVVRLSDGDLYESDLQNLRNSRLYLQTFMRSVNALATQRGAPPRQWLGVPDRDDEASLLQTYLLSRKAAEMGIQVTDDSIIRYLESYSDEKIDKSEFATVLSNIGQGRMSQSRFFNAMRNELMALRFMELFQRGIAPLPPSASWDYYQRLYRQVSVEAVPFGVSGYTERVSEPSETAIAQLYEEGKDRYPFPNSAEAGFKQRKKVALQYVKADLQTFLDQEKLKITDEQVQTYYEANKQEYRNVGLPPSQTGAATTEPPDSGVTSPDTGNELDSPLPLIEGPGTLLEEDTREGGLLPAGVLDATVPEAESPLPAVDELPTVDELPSLDDLPNLEGPVVDEIEAQEPGVEEPANEEAPGDESPADESPADDAAAEDVSEQQEPSAPESAAGDEPQPLQDDPTDEGPKVNEAPELEEAEKTTGADAASAAAESTDAEAPAEQPAGAGPDDSEAQISDETEAEGSAPMEEPTEPETSPDADPASADTSATVDESAADDLDLGTLPDAPGNNLAPPREEYRPLEEVADEIRTRLARPVARERMDSAIAAVRTAMRSYYSTYIAWYVSEEHDTKPQPDAPDLAALAEQYKLSAEEIPLVDVLQLQETDPVTAEPLYEISRAYDTNLTPFARIALDSDLPLYKEGSIRGAILDTEFLFWKTDEAAERTPTLAECGDEVVQILKLREALKLAQAEARKEAERVRSSGESLGEVYGNDPSQQVVETGSFSWITPASVPYLPPQISRVPGIEFPGPDFMREVFRLSEGEIGVATDNAQRTVYLVSLKSEDSDPEKLKTEFFRAGMSMEIAQLSQQENRELMAEWYQEYEKQMGVKWEREPLPDSRVR